MWGGAVFIFGFVGCPLLVPLVAASGLSSAWKAVLSGVLLVGGPEVFMFIAIAILGKPGFQYLKGRLLALVKRQVLTDTVSPTRYRIGLVLLAIPIAYGWLGPYATPLVGSYEQYHLPLAIAGDVILVISVIVLGGDFWDKLRSLFVHDARVQFARS